MKYRIFIVEDDETIANLLKKHLSMMYQMDLDRTKVTMEVTAVVSPLEAVLRMLAGNRITTTGILNTRMAIM